MRTRRGKIGLFFAVSIMAVGLLGSTAMAAVYTDPVGFVKTGVVKNGLTMISIPLNASVTDPDMKKINGPAGCIGDQIKENLAKGPAMGSADVIWKWDPNATPQKYSKAFYAGNLPPGFEYMEGKWFDPDLGDLSTMTLGSGDTCFIQRVNLGADEVIITFLGWVDVSPSVNVPLVQGLTMFSYPYPALPTDPTPGDPLYLNDTDIGDIAQGGPAMGSADAVFRWNPAIGGGNYTKSFYAAGLPAGFEEFEDKWFDPDAFALTSISFEIGEALWYMRVGGDTTWPVTRPFTLD